MSETAQTPSNPEIPVQELLLALRRKQGNWVEWGQACQTLQKAGYKPQEIFEETGFEPIHQNQVIVGAQVFTSIANGGISDETKEHFQQRGSDILYELRILTQAERVAAAEYIFGKQFDVDVAKEIAKAIKEFSRFREAPEGFSNHPGDAAAYQCWKRAKQKSDFQQRSRLIAEGLKFAHSESARKEIEKLLTDFTVMSEKPAPRLPTYRLESSEDLPRLLPVVGTMPVSPQALQAMPPVEETGDFHIVNSGANSAWVPVPGWQVIRNAKDPVVVVWNSKELPVPIPGKAEEVLAVIDRGQQEWDEFNYFAVDRAGELQLQWFVEMPDIPLLGKLVLIMRPKNIFDENYTNEPWQIDE